MKEISLSLFCLMVITSRILCSSSISLEFDEESRSELSVMDSRQLILQLLAYQANGTPVNVVVHSGNDDEQSVLQITGISLVSLDKNYTVDLAFVLDSAQNSDVTAVVELDKYSEWMDIILPINHESFTLNCSLIDQSV